MIPRELVKEGLADPLQRYETALKEEWETLGQLMNEADRAGVKAVYAYREYSAAFKEIKEQLRGKMVLSQCLWLAERRYLRQASEAITLLRGLSFFVFHLVKRFVDLENARIAAIRQAMVQFISLQEAAFVSLQIAESTTSALDSVSKLTENSMFANLFQDQEMQVIKQLTTAETPIEALTTWELVVPSPTPLTLVRGKIYKEEGNLWTKLKGVVSADGFLHGFDHKNDEDLVNPVFSLALLPGKLDFELNPQALSLQFQMKKSRLKMILNKPGVILLKCSSKKKFERWMTAVTKFLPAYTVVDSV